MKEIIQADVCVAGGGMAGIGAAVAAARSGARTLLVERYGFLGGVASWGMGMPINQMRPDERPRGAIHEMLIKHLQHFGEEAYSIPSHQVVCNVEYLKAAFFNLLDSVHCSYMLHSRIVDAVVVRNRIQSIVVGTKEGLCEIQATIVVDATGDADVACYAGAETMKGREGDGFLSPMTLNLLVTGIDVSQARQFQEDGGLARVIDKGRRNYQLLPDLMTFEVGPHPLHGCLVVNHSGTKRHGLLDASTFRDFTGAEHFSRLQAIEIVSALREFGGPVFSNIQLAATGAQVGVRETRRIKGMYVLTENDAMTGSRFDDAIAWRSGMLDIGFTRFEEMKVHDVPYRALVSCSTDNLLASGRCISATHVAASAGKSMGNCMATGHAAGLAAALCVQNGCMPGNINVRELQGRLAEDGVSLSCHQ